MSNISAHDALEYALQRDVLLLAAAIVAGGLLAGLGFAAVGDVHAGALIVIVQNLFGIAAVVGGIALQVGGGVGLLYKVVRDATA